eukprot:1160926-Pelagomonas_calceolata.AAC.7
MQPREEGEGEEPPMVPEPNRERDEELELPSMEDVAAKAACCSSQLGAWGEQCRQGKQAGGACQPQLPAEEEGQGQKQGKGLRHKGARCCTKPRGQGA